MQTHSDNVLCSHYMKYVTRAICEGNKVINKVMELYKVMEIPLYIVGIFNLHQL